MLEFRSINLKAAEIDNVGPSLLLQIMIMTSYDQNQGSAFQNLIIVVLTGEKHAQGKVVNIGRLALNHAKLSR